MCGIATISIGRKTRKMIPYGIIRDLVSELLVELEVRGNDAAGLAVINDSDSSPSLVFKKPLRPSCLVVRPKFKESLESIGPETNFILLHARAATVGNNRDNFNNHPIIIPGCVGIHNGTLRNHLALFWKHEEDFKQLGDVDSEIIFQLYKYHVSRGLESQDAIQTVAESLNGAFTGALVDLKHRHRLVMFKYERTLALITIPHYDIVLAISEPCFYARVADRLGIKAKATCQLVKEGTGIIIDLNTKGRITNDIKLFELPVAYAGEGKMKHSNWLSTYESIH